MRLGSTALAVALLAACNAQISDGLGANVAMLIDAPSDITADPAPGPDSTPAPSCASRTLYLNFDGQTLTKGPSDATLNQASWLSNIQIGTAPPYLDGVADRAATIQSIVNGVRMQLAQFPITVVTIRPAAGPYVMIVLGGKQATIGSRFSAAVNQLDCGDTRPSDVAWIGDNVTPVQHVVNTVIGAVGFGLGLTGVADPEDCMCAWANACVADTTVACKLRASVARDQAATQLCPSAGPTQDEVAALRTAFCGM
jgi:hypothetical protein